MSSATRSRDVELRPTKNPRKAYIVLIAGLLSNFSVGILYTWSNIRDGLQAYEQWDVSQLTVPYSIGGMVFAATLILAGGLQDRFGPRKVMLTGVSLVGGGTILSSFAVPTPILFYFTFGVIVGLGLAFVYACPRPAAMKWFDPSKKGMINGIVVTGFGLGAIWIGAVQSYLLRGLGWDIQQTLLALGVLIWIIGLAAASQVVDPPKGYVPPKPKRDESKPEKATHKLAPSVPLKVTIRTKQAWMIMSIYALYCSAGALVIGSVTSILSTQTAGGTDGAFSATLSTLLALAVPMIAIANAIGRSSGGIGSDYLGRRETYMVMHIAAAVNLFLLQFYSSPIPILIGCLVQVALYGAALAVTPSIVADYFGLKAYGANYGFVYYGWGASLIIGPTLGSLILAQTGSYVFSYYVGIGLIALSFVVVLMLRHPKFKRSDVLDSPDEIARFDAELFEGPVPPGFNETVEAYEEEKTGAPSDPGRRKP